MIKKFVILIGIFAIVWGSGGVALAIPISFDLAGEAGGSSVMVADRGTGLFASGDITGQIAGDLDDQMFTLNDGESKTVDFFTLTASGFSVAEIYTVSATLAFDLPDIDAAGAGGGTFTTLFGLISGGTLAWDESSLPDYFTVGDNTIMVDFEDGWTIVLGDTAMVHATITNLGSGGGENNAPVPEPATMLLLGTGLAGFAVIRRRKSLKS